ncbi:inhibitor of growth protein 4 [Pelomyxa schiedti]|nr:inhibitor of growth protein 4 [Pelomyxa schiedti]
MMHRSYLENYLESISTLPGDVGRNLMLMKDLDERAQQLLVKIDAGTQELVRSGSDTSNSPLSRQIRENLKSARLLSDEKVSLATQTYEMIDRNIRRLDSELKKFESELDSINAHQPPEVDTSEIKGLKAKGKKGPVHKASTDDDMDPEDNAQTRQIDFDLPVDPNEPTYCLCHRVSFGQMVCCDNPECEIEWFHFECVGLTTSPKGKWYCPNCKALLQRKKF